MLMRLLWSVAEPLVASVMGAVPDAPEPVEVVLPWPAAVPFWPFATVLAAVLVCGAAALVVRFARWVYGLIPVIQ